VTTCAVPGRKHQADEALQICRNHLDELGEWLYEIEEEEKKLDARPSLQGSWNATRGGRLASHQSPARINPLVHSDPRYVLAEDLTTTVGIDGTLSVFGTLHGWANQIRDGREIKFPGRWITEQLRPGPICVNCSHASCRWMVHRYFQRDELTVATERQFLSRHLEWAAGHSWIGDLHEDIRKLRAQLQAANGTGELQIPGRCPEPECDGPLRVAKPEHTSGAFFHVGENLLQAVVCENNPSHRWEAARLIRLGVLLDEQKKRK
jgi:hypothetical protein